MRPLPRDSAVNGILLSNAITLALAWWAGDGLIFLLWPYWIQSVVIGYFAQRRIRRLRDFSVEGLKINGRPATNTPSTAKWSANFFVVHYGLFHLVYAIFLTTFSAGADVEWLGVVVAGLSFAWSHAASHRMHVEHDLRGKPNLGALMFVPYVRIVPMHLTIILGTVLGGGLFGMLLFASLKTAADVAMHYIEHRMLQRTAT